MHGGDEHGHSRNGEHVALASPLSLIASASAVNEPDAVISIMCPPTHIYRVD